MPETQQNSQGETPWGTAKEPWEPGRIKAMGTEANYARASRQLDIALLQLKTAVAYRRLDQKLEVVKQAFHAYLAELDPKSFDPNQPRVPAGNGIYSGRWADEGSPGGSLSQFVTADDERPAGTRVAGRSGRGGQSGRRRFTRPELEFVRNVREGEARRAIERVREIEPGWQPRGSISTNSIEGEIARAEGRRDEAIARWRELTTREPNSVIDAFRRGHGLETFNDTIWPLRKNTVAHCTFDGQVFLGVNSKEKASYTQHDDYEAKQLRAILVEFYPRIMNTNNIGQKPNDALFHAETTCLLRATRANGGTLAGKTVEVTVDRRMCRSCEEVLPLVGLELGNPEVTFVDPFGNVKTMRDGRWIKGK